MKRNPTLLATCGALLAGLLSANAQIMVGPTGSPVETFSTQPAAAGTEWATGSFGTAPANYTTAAALDAALQDSYQEFFVTAVGSSSTQPPSPANIARRNTSASQGLYMQIRPNNDRGAVVLKATLQNDTGGVVPFLNVSYTFGLAIAAGSVAAEEIPGWRAFYSMSGEAYTWQPIPQFTTGAPGELSASLNTGEWANGSLMYIVWVDDDAAAHTTAPNLEGAYYLDNFLAVPSAGRSPSLTQFQSSATGWRAIFEDGTGTLALNTASFAATVNGQAVTTTTVKEGDVVTVTWTTSPQAPGTVNDVVLNFANQAAPPLQDSITRTYTVNPYVVIPASYAVQGVDTGSSGFTARTHQILGVRGPGDQNSTLNAERQLMDLIMEPGVEPPTPYMNLTLPSNDPDGLYRLETVNLNVEATAAGNFSSTSTPSRPDAPVPGLDGVSGNLNIAAEFLTYLDLKAGTVYTMGVNSDDGFNVSVSPNPRDATGLRLGNFNTGRGVQDSLFDFMVAADGIYPFRLSWWQGAGGGAVEWFTVNPDGTKVLLNDREIAGHVKAYSAGPASTPFVAFVSPLINDTNAPANVVLELYVQDGATTTVSPGGIQLFVNDQNVTANATFTKPEGSNRTLVTYDPPGDLPPETRLNVRVVYTDSASVARTGTYWVQVKPLILVGIDDVTNWRLHARLDDTVDPPVLRLRGEDLGTAWRETTYADTAENGWVDAKALIADETGATAEPIRTPVSRFSSAEITTSAMTMYTRTRFNFTGNPGSVILLLRHVLDDGAVFYLNGIELYRFGIGATVNPVLYTTGSGGNENASRGPFVVPRAALRVGENILAVETHQDANTSSDIVFGAELMVVADPAAAPARIATTSPVNNAINVRITAPIAIQMEDGSTSVDPSTVRLFVNDQLVNATVNKPAGGILTTVNYTPAAGSEYAPESTVNVRVEFRDTQGTLRNETFSFQTLPRMLVDVTADQLWHIHAALDESAPPAVLRLRGEDLGTAWREAGYEYSAANGWVTGAAMIGDETGATVEPIRTPVSRFPVAGGTGVSAMYTATTFNFTGDPTTAQLRLRHAVDDGAVFYLNGQEVHRFWMAEGDVTYATLAGVGFTPTDHENAWEGPFDISNSALRVGENILQVETHQNGTGSSDIVMGVQLQILGAVVEPPDPVFTGITVNGGQVTFTWQNTGILQESDNLTTPNWTDLPNATSPYSPPGSNAGMKFYRFKP